MNSFCGWCEFIITYIIIKYMIIFAVSRDACFQLLESWRRVLGLSLTMLNTLYFLQTKVWCLNNLSSPCRGPCLVFRPRGGYWQSVDHRSWWCLYRHGLLLDSGHRSQCDHTPHSTHQIRRNKQITLSYHHTVLHCTDIEYKVCS